MGQGLSCRQRSDHALFGAIEDGTIETVEAMVDEDLTVLERRTSIEGLSALHLAASNGKIQVLSMLLDRSVNPDILNRHKQTALMLAAKNGNISCVESLIQAGANILMFDGLNSRTCLHYAAQGGHSDCLEAILSSTRSSPVAASWGFARFVNIRDKNGATPLHLAAKQGRSECVHALLDSGALVCASTGGFGYQGSAPLHYAARSGSLDCVRELLSWGADRLQRDSSGRIPYLVALKYKHKACAALLSPSAPEPLIWPSSSKFISDLNPEAKALLERALIDKNKEREKSILKEMEVSIQSCANCEAEPIDNNDDSISEDSDVELCCICFDQVCTIEVQSCGHQMCAHCTLALCCHNKINSSETPICPFCRCNITQLRVAEIKIDSNVEMESSLIVTRKSRKSSVSANEGSSSSSSFKGLSAMGSFARLGSRSAGKVAAQCDCKY
ncbi:putative E3 ubiquitin-protein ligase XBAT31 [Impatiens glandulifera]|uniref:putative E3 ubiquitin-protein ligase XBAT31 n=1 Tax=Impatiens glandulifera TaxID=253017 RepID=UPI001FB062D5|nr:putative E3 ubiquitin-protein ligase XBAT31 [Impatiens glandulifera]